MNILVLGASGFLGRHVVDALRRAGHAVVAGARRPPGEDISDIEHRALDFNRVRHAQEVAPALRGIDVVINTVGIFRESRGRRFTQLHDVAPRALFDACVQSGVRRVIQVSALGADAQARSAYHLSKRAADDYLLSLKLDAVVVQPSLIYGTGGTSAALFGTLASMPWVPALDLGEARLQPIHIEDAAAAIVALVDVARLPAPRIALVGPRALSWREFMSGLRRAMGLPRARFVPVPAQAMALLARIGNLLPGALLDTAAWQMLRRGNSADVAPLRGLLGRLPREVSRFVEPACAPALRTQAQLGWWLPVARLSLAMLWIVTGIVSLGVYPVQDSYALLEQAGVPQAVQPLALQAASWLDIALGGLILMSRRLRWVWAAQASLILVYTAIITWRLPEFWLHPYGPILKNLPLLALLWLLHELERPWNTR